ncbi:ribosomal protein L31 [Saonia flava]|uniref:Ribosomal protein L31 n=1 Tax=Saonia flava TaxID=523696 RepID=A0A846QUL0_9FLAO|nr:head GIN domain-containing protein [Saonia flava]NJB70232.1 ribosomal protein L31 [Saonia flava]
MKNQRNIEKGRRLLKGKAIALLLFVILGVGRTLAQTKTFPVDVFNKVVVSPHIQVKFIEGERESVFIETSSVPMDKINVEVQGKTLNLYLDGAKVVTKSERVEDDKWKGKKSIYKGTIVTAIVTYKNLEELSLRGEETFVCESFLDVEKFRLKIYGESQVYLNKVNIQDLRATIYGESYLEIKEGTINEQKITAYGETTVNTADVNSQKTKIKAYGEGSYRVHVSENLKVTAYGEAIVAYEGNPTVNRGIIIGEATIQKIQ